MEWLQALFLGALQGVTEFLPVSSSGHLVLFQSMFWPDDPKTADSAREWFFDGVLHLGTLLAVIAYFGKEFSSSVRTVLSRPASAEPTWPASYRDVFWLCVWVGIASLPAALAVLGSGDWIKDSFKRPGVVAFNFLILGAVLILTDRLTPGTTTGPTMKWWQALIIGLAQGASALMRGLSRSGSTMAAALLVGLERSWAVRFSFLMSVVASFLPALSVDPQKQQRLTKLALFFMKRYGVTEVMARFDVVTLAWPKGAKEPRIDYYPDAFPAVGQFRMYS